MVAEFVARLFYSSHNFVSPAIIIHTPDARITAANAASRKSHCFFFEPFLFQLAFVCSAITVRVTDQACAPGALWRGNGATRHCITQCRSGQQPNCLGGMKMDARRTSRQNRRRVFSFTRRHILEVGSNSTLSYTMSLIQNRCRMYQCELTRQNGRHVPVFS